MYDVKIRFNTNYPAKSNKKWRCIVDGTQYFVDSIDVECRSFTSQDTVIGDDGQEIEKFHISCECNNIEFQITNPESESKTALSILGNLDLDETSEFSNIKVILS